MAANTVITSTVQIQADTRNARAQIQDVINQLNKIANTQPLKFDSQELKVGVQSARDLRDALQAAFNADTGRLNLTAFNNSLNKAKNNLSNIQQGMASFGASGQAAFSAVTNAINTAKQETVTLGSHFNSLLTNLKKTAQWQISSSLIHGFVGKLNEAVGYAKDLNESLNNIQIVTQMSNSEIAQFATNAQKAAQSLSSSTLAFSDAALIYFQQGDKMATAMQKAEITMKAAAISFNSSAQDMSEYLTAIWNSYQVGENEMQKYVDIMANLGANTATSMEEISTALQKVAATANNVGVGMDQMSSIIATSASVTRQSAETIGTSWNTILSRIGGLKLGQTLEDGVDLNKYSKALRSVGIEILDAQGELREMGGVIDEIGQKWGTMSKAQQSALAQTIGGARQYTQMMAFFDNYKTYEVNLKIADDSQGALDKQFATWEKSWEAATGRMKNAWQGLYSEIINDDAFITMTDSLTNILNLVTQLIDKMGGIVPVIGMVGAAFAANFAGKGGFSQMFSKMGTNFNIMTGMANVQSIGTQRRLAEVATTASANRSLNVSQKQDYLTQAAISRANASRLMNEAHWSQSRKDAFNNQRAVVEQATADRRAAYDAYYAKEASVQKSGILSKVNQNAFGQYQGQYTSRGKIANQGTLNKYMQTTNAQMAAMQSKMTDAASTASVSGQDAMATQIRAKAKAIQDAYKEYTDALQHGSQQEAETKRAILNQAVGDAGSIGSDILQRIHEAIAQLEAAEDRLQNLKGQAGQYVNDQGQFDSEAAKKGILEASGKEGSAGRQAAEQALNGIELKADNFDSVVQNAADKAGELRTKLAAVSTATEEMEDSFGNAGQKMENAAADMGQLKEKAEEAAEGEERARKGLEDLGNSEPAKISDTIGKVSAGFMGLAASAATVTTSISTIFSDDENITAGQRLIAVITLLAGVMSAVTSAVTISNAVMGTSAGIKATEAAASVAGAAANTGLAVSFHAAAAGAKAFFASLGPIGWVLLALTAVASIVIAIVNAMKNTKSPAEKLAESMEGVKAGIENVQTSSDTLKSDLQELAAIMRDTTASYDEQLARINAITEAYGVQASAVDVLSGNYGNLSVQMQQAAAARAEFNKNNAQAQVEAAEAAVQDYIGANTDTATTIWRNKDGTVVDASEIAQFRLNISQQDLDAKIAQLKATEEGFSQLDGWEQSQRAKEALVEAAGYIAESYVADYIGDEVEEWSDTVSLFTNEAWTEGVHHRKDNSTWGIWEHIANGDANSIANKYTTAEGQVWFNQDFQAELEKAGWSLDYRDGRLVSNDNSSMRSQEALYQLLTGDYFKDIALSSDSFTAKLIEQLRTGGIETLVQTREQAQAQALIADLFSDNKFDFLRVGKEDATTKEVSDLISAVSQTTTAAERAQLLQYIGGFTGWEQGTRTYEALDALSASATTIKYQGSKKDELERIQRGVTESLAQLVDEEGKEIPVDVILRINPTDIEIEDSDGKIKATISKKARAFAEAQIATEKAQVRKQELTDNKKIATASTISQDNYATLASLDVFKDNQALLDQFVASSAGTRATMWSQLVEQATKAELDGLDAQVQLAKERLQELETDINQWLEELVKNETAQKLLEEAGITNATEMKGADMYGALANQRFTKQSRVNEIQQILDAYEALDKTSDKWQTSDATKAFETQYGVKIGDITNLREEQKSLNSELTTYNALLEKGDQLYGAQIDTASRQQQAQQQQNAAQYWQATGKAIEDATNNAKAFGGAIGNMGKVSAADLAQMQYALRDTKINLYDLYDTMTSQEWDNFVLTHAIDEYDKLIAEYHKVGDAAAEMEAKQSQAQLRQTYYAQLETQNENAAAAIRQNWEEVQTAADKAATALNKLISKPDDALLMTNAELIELRQNLEKAGYSAEKAQEVINKVTNPNLSAQERIETATFASANASLASLSTLYEEQNEFTGKAVLVTYDATMIEPVEVQTDAQVQTVVPPEQRTELDATANIRDTTPPEEAPDLDATATILTADGLGAKVTNVDYQDGTLTIQTADGASAQLSGIDYTNGSVTIAKADGSTAEVTGISYENGSVIITTADGSTAQVTGIDYTDGTLTIATADGSTAELKGITYSGASIAISSADGTGAKVTNVVYEDGTLKIATADGKLATVTGVDYKTGTIHLQTADGTGATVQGVVYEDGSVKIKTADGSEATVSGVNYENGTVTIKTADGTDAEVTNISYTDGFLSIATADGTGAQIQNVEYCGGKLTITKADGSTATLDAPDKISIKGGKLILASADGSSLNATTLPEGTEITVGGGQLSLDDAIEGDISSLAEDGSYRFVVEGGHLKLANAEVGSELAAKQFDLQNGQLVLAKADDQIAAADKVIEGGTINITTKSVNISVNYTPGDGQDLVSDRSINVSVNYESGKNTLYEAWKNKRLNNMTSSDLAKASDYNLQTLLKELGNEGNWWDWLQGDTSWAADNAKVAGMISISESLKDIDYSALDNIGKQQIQAYLTAIHKAAQSNNETVKNVGKMLIAGLPVGMQQAIASTDWSGAVSNLGAILEQIFAEAAQTHSPSQITIEIGHYLVEGLEVGISEGIASADWAGTVSGLGDAIKAAFEAELKKVDAGELTKGIIPSNYKELIAEAGQNAYDAKVAEYVDLKSMSDQDIARLYRGTGAQLGLDPSGKLTDWEYITREAEKARQEAMDTKGQEIANNFQRDWFEGGYLDSKTLTVMQKAILGAAISAVSKEDATLDKSSQEFLNKVQAYVEKEGATIQYKIEAEWANLEDTLASGANAIYANEQATAQATYELWKATYEAIAKARKGLIEGDSIATTLLGDIAAQTAIIQQMLNSDSFTNLAEIMEYLRNPKADASKLQVGSFNTSDWQNAGNQRFLNWQNGRLVDTSYEQYLANVNASVNARSAEQIRKWWESDPGISGYSSYQQMLDRYNNLNLATTRSADDIAELERLSKVLAPIIDNVATRDAQTGRYSIDLSDNALTEAVRNSLINAFTLSESDFNALYAEAIARSSDSITQAITDAAGLGENYIKERDKEAEIVTKARDALLKGQEIEDVLTPEELTKLNEIMGDTPITVDSLNAQLDSLASAAMACASALQQLATMIAGGNATGGYVDAEGKVHATKDNKEEIVGFNTNEANGDAGYQASKRAELAAQGFKETYISDNGDVHFSRVVIDEVDIPEGTGLTDTNNETVDDAKYSGEKNFEAYIKALADGAGMAKDAFIEYAEAIMAVNGETRTFNELSQQEQKEWAELARLASMADDGWTSFNKSAKDNIKAMKEGVKGTKAYSTALNTLTKDIKNIFGGSKAVTKDFVEKNLDLIEQMNEGVEGAAEKVEEAVLRAQLSMDGLDYDKQINFDVNTDGVVNQLDTIGALLNSFGDEHANEPIGFTATLDNTPAIAGLNDLLAAGAMTVDQMNAALATIGWEPEIEYQQMTMAEAQAAHVTAYVRDNAGNYVKIDGSQNLDNNATVYVPIIKSAKKTGGGGAGAATHPPASSGGGGGGGGGDKKKDRKDDRDIERYHQVNNALEQQGRLLTKNDKLKNRAYGLGYLNTLKQENKELAKQNQLYRDKWKEAEEWLAADKLELMSYGATFTGDQINYYEYMHKLNEEYNAMAAQYEAGGIDDDAWEKFEKDWERKTKAVENYEEALQIAEEMQNEMLENQNKMSANNLAAIEYKVKLKVDLNSADVKLLQYFQDKWNDDLTKSADLVKNLTDEALDYVDTLNEIQNNGIAKLEAAHNEYQQWYDAFQAGQRDLEMPEGAINDADYIKGLEEYRDQILENLQSLLKVQQSIKEAYKDMIELADKEMETYTSIMDHRIKMASQFRSMAELMGQGKNYDFLSEMYQVEIEQGLEAIDITRAYFEEKAEQVAYYYDKCAGDISKLSEEEQRYYWDAVKSMEESQQDLLDYTEAVLQALKSDYENTIHSISKEFETSITGSYKTIQDLLDDYNWYTEVEERHLSTAKQLYEMSKLNRQINQSISDGVTSQSKERLRALQEVINKQAELNELTEYDVKQMQLQYKLALALDALENAQGSKDTVRLIRDQNGNYGYQYTADEEKVNKAQQDYEDVLQEINETAASRVKELEQMYLETLVEYREKAEQIALEYEVGSEEYIERMAELNAKYKDKLSFISEQYGIATEHLMINQDTLMLHYETKNAFTTDQINNDVQKLINKESDHAAAMDRYTTQIQEAMERYASKVEEAASRSKTALDDMSAALQEAKKHTDAAATAAQELTGKLHQEFAELKSATAAWLEHKNQIQSVIQQYENLYRQIQKTIEAANKLNNTQPTVSSSGGNNQSGTSNPQSPSTPSGGGNNGGGNGGNGGGTGGGTPTAEKPKTATLICKATDMSGNQIKSVTHSNLTPCVVNFAAFFPNPGGDWAFQYASPQSLTLEAGKTSTITYRYNKKPTETANNNRGGGGCFIKGSKIMMADNTIKNIEDVIVGDWVVAYNDELHIFEPRKVTKSYIHYDTPRVITISLSNGITLGITPGHPILTKMGWRSRDIMDSYFEHGTFATWLEIGDEIIGYDENVYVTDIQDMDIPEHYSTYNIEVDTCHTFTVYGLVVHNMKVAAYGTGGLNDFTGPAWLDGSKEHPEYVLNPKDTEHMFNVIGEAAKLDSNTVNNIVKTLNMATYAMLGGLGTITASSISTTTSDLNQNVEIHADFPNVTERSEIEAAFDDLINRATQYANRK